MGQHLVSFQCFNTTGFLALSRLVKAAANDGCWCCFEAADRLDGAGLRVLLNHVQAVLQALRAAVSSFTLPGQGEVSGPGKTLL